MTLTNLQHTVAIPRARPGRKERPTRTGGDDARLARYAHGALLAVLVGLAATTVAYAIVRETAAALTLLVPIALQIRWAATAALQVSRRTGDRHITFVP